MRSNDRGDSWEKISPNLDGRAFLKLSESPIDEKRLVAGGRKGIYFTSNGGGTWELRSEGLPRHTVTALITSNHKPETVYVAMEGNSNRGPTSYLFVTSDFGKSWKSIGGGLPLETVYSVAEDPKTDGLLFAGTELGVYVSTDSGKTWNSLCNSLPPVPVYDLEVHARDSVLVAATHGLSIFSLEIGEVRDATDAKVDQTDSN